MTTSHVDIVGLGHLAQGLLGPRVSIGYSQPASGDVESLMEAELPGAARMVPKRQREFAAGRSAVRMAAKARGMVPFAVPMGPDRAPVWPRDVIGSIAHTNDACLAAVSSDLNLASIGIDLELDIPLPTPVADAVCSGTDRVVNQLSCQTLGDRFALIVFAAKEAAYKCQYPLTKTLIDFDALSIRLSPDKGTFVARFERRSGAFCVGATLTGLFSLFGGQVLTAAWITRSEFSAYTAQERSMAE